MSKRFAAAIAALCGAACTSATHRVGGRVRGIWDGADGVALRLQAHGFDTLLSVPTNGGFQFPDELTTGSSYVVTVSESPARHSCEVDAGGNGVIGNSDATDVSIACTGPALSVEFSESLGSKFDPTQDGQTFDASIFVDRVALTVAGAELTSVIVNGVITPPGATSAPAALELGTTSVTLNVAAGDLQRAYLLAFRRGRAPVEQLAYGKPSHTGADFGFGTATALDGDTLVIGAPDETVAATTGGADVQSVGAVYVFVRAGGAWTQQARLTPPLVSDAVIALAFGSAVAVSGDTIAIGAPGDDSGSTGIGGNPADLGAFESGAVHVFVRTGTSWAPEAYIKASNTGEIDRFGSAVALFDDTLAVGAPNEDSAASGVDPPAGQASEGAQNAGAVYVLRRTGTAWAQEAYVKPSTALVGDSFGSSVALFQDSLAVGAPGEASSTTGIGGDEHDATSPGAGAAYVFTRSGARWSQQAYVKASNTRASDSFGGAIALSSDTLAVGAVFETGTGSGIDADPQLRSTTRTGAVYVYHRAGALWSPQTYLKSSHPSGLGNFGAAVALAGDLLAVGASFEASGPIDPADHMPALAGTAYVYSRSDGKWAEAAHLTASNPDESDEFGNSIALSGTSIAIAARGEASASTGVPSTGQSDNSAPEAGAIYLYR